MNLYSGRISRRRIAVYMFTKVAVCQVPDIRSDVGVSLQWIEKFTREAEEKGASLICFPECFLQGYITEKSLAGKNAINLHSRAFTEIINQLTKYNPMIVFGMIEEDDGLLFNTVVVIKDGLLIGKYRQLHNR